MARKKLPRYLLYGIGLSVAVAALVLSMFYGQQRWLADRIIADGTAQHREYLQKDFESAMQTRMRLYAAALQETPVEDATAELNRLVAGNAELSGLRLLVDGDEVTTVGNVPAVPVASGSAWLEDRLILEVPATLAASGSASLAGSFSLDELNAESARFASGLVEREYRHRQSNYLLIGLATLAALATCMLIVWLIAKDQAQRIRTLRTEAARLADADYTVETLDETRDDQLGQLAAVFNRMRGKLVAAETSRDYADNVLARMNDAIIVTTNEGRIKRINNATTQLLGYAEDELIGTDLDYVVDSKRSGSLVRETTNGLPKEAFLESKFGESIPVSYTCSVLDSEGGSSGDRIYAAQNTTERRRAEQRIRYLARIDALTKIPNRMQFQHLLQRAIARARRSGRSLCLFYIDIDNFKEINDTFGHLAGDTTLETVAERLTSALPPRSVIGRLAGDEFAVIVDGARPDEEDKGETDRLARDLLQKLADPFFVQGHEVFLTASMGLAFYPQDAPNVIDLIRNADAALYHAKKSGGNMHVYYVPRMNEAAVERLMTKSKLKRAFERDELLVHYQPKYNLATGEVFGAEALVRWELPDRGLILPSDFIPIAEESNLIIEIGEWVLDRVCEDFRHWQKVVQSPGRVSVNLSLKQLRQRNFPNRISAILRSYEVSPTSLELEITETTLMENPERTIKLLDQLYALGLHLAIDDFGTGYSSLSALQQFPISTLKIDQSFVRHVTTNADDATLVGTIVQMGRNMDMDVVAEGVEEPDQLAFLQSIDCTYAQGLLFGDPMSADNYLELLLAHMDGTGAHKALFA